MQIQLSEHFTYKKLIRFTLPTIFMMIFTSIYGVVDGIFVSNIVGSDSFAAVNLITPVLMIMASVGFMFGTGGSALVSKVLGEGDKKRANQYFSMLTYILLVIGVIFTILGLIFIKPVASLLRAEGNILKDCVTYGSILMLSMIPFLLQHYFQSFLIVAEKPKMGLVVSLCAGITNIILDFLFVYAFRWGLIGAAVATAISECIGGIVPLTFFIVSKDSPLKLRKAKLDGKAVFQTCTNGSSEMLTHISLSAVNMLYNMQLMKYIGSDGVVAYGIIMYVSFAFISAFLGYSIGSSPIVSYHYGANNTDELKNLFKKSLIILISSSVVLTILAELSAKLLAGIFVSYDPNLLALTTRAIRIYSISFVMAGFNIYASSFFTALNNGVVSAIISFLRTLVFEVLSILILPAILGIDGIWFAVVVSGIFSTIISTIFLVANRKKYNYV